MVQNNEIDNYNASIESALGFVDQAVESLGIEEDERIKEFTTEPFSHEMPGRVYSFMGNDLLQRNIHVYIDPEDRNLAMNVEVNAWSDKDAKRKFVNAQISTLPLPTLSEPVSNALQSAFDKVLSFSETDLH